MSLNLASLNQRYNYLLNLVNSIITGITPVPTSSALSVVLTNGNSAGTNDIDMNDNKLLQCSEITASNNLVVSSNNLRLAGDRVAILQNAGVTSQGSNAVAIGVQSGNFQQSSNSISIGNEAGRNNQNSNSIGVGISAGKENQSSHSVAIGSLAGENTQSNESIAIGRNAGRTNQSTQSVAIGSSSGNSAQGTQCVAIGRNSGQNNQGNRSVAIGNSTANNGQGLLSVAIGENSGQNNKQQYSVSVGAISGQNNQGENSIAIGRVAGGQNQGNNSIALGFLAGTTDQGTDCIALGQRAGQVNQHNNSIVLNATGLALNTDVSNAFFVAPMREKSGNYLAQYDTNNKEVSYSNTVDVSTDLLFECENMGVRVRQGTSVIYSDANLIEFQITEDINNSILRFTATDPSATIESSNNLSVQCENMNTVVRQGNFRVDSDTNRIEMILGENVNGSALAFIAEDPSAIIESNNDLIITSSGNLTLNCPSVFDLSGAGLISATAGGNSGNHLVLTINGTPYKIKLENP